MDVRAKTRGREAATLSLIAINSQEPEPIVLRGGGPIVFGRRPEHTVCLADRPEVSREHAVMQQAPPDGGGRWVIEDLESRHGSYLNGVRLTPHRSYPVRVGDLIRIGEITFLVVDPTSSPDPATVYQTLDDDADDRSTVSEIDLEDVDERVAQRQLQLLLRCAEAIHAAPDEGALARAIVEATAKATGFEQVALLRPPQDGDQVTVLASHGAIQSATGGPALSRSLIARASSGRPVQLVSPPQSRGASDSVKRLGIVAAICVPITLGDTVCARLYMDMREADVNQRRESLTEAMLLAVGLGRLAGVAWAGLLREQLRERVTEMEREIAALAEAQRWVLPADRGVIGGVRYVGRSQPGKVVSGDFFDVIELDEARLAVTVGDVMGKGPSASLLMAVAQGFLRAAMQDESDPRRAVEALNVYVSPRCREGLFLTLWMAVIDARRGSIQYVDAGHGYALLTRPGHQSLPLDAGGGLVIGASDQARYETVEVPFTDDDQLIVVSDGLIEQARADASEQRQEFGFGRLKACAADNHEPEMLVEKVFEAVRTFSGTDAFADDATALSLWLDAKT